MQNLEELVKVIEFPW